MLVITVPSSALHVLKKDHVKRLRLAKKDKQWYRYGLFYASTSKLSLYEERAIDRCVGRSLASVVDVNKQSGVSEAQSATANYKQIAK